MILLDSNLLLGYIISRFYVVSGDSIYSADTLEGSFINEVAHRLDIFVAEFLKTSL